MEFDRAKT